MKKVSRSSGSTAVQVGRLAMTCFLAALASVGCGDAGGSADELTPGSSSGPSAGGLGKAPPELSEADLESARNAASAQLGAPEPPSGQGFATGARAYARLVIFTNGCVTPNLVTVDSFPTGYFNEQLAAEYANFAAQQHLRRVRAYFGANCFNDAAQGVGSLSNLAHGHAVASDLNNNRIASYRF